ncbi:hypothetical protein Ddye_024187 [Dipteronia dyeriana]|uniref:Agenet-like domain-containing protein n=1 Tax=Dipteronia dyeriana TaxID=168575 RepID=A0AAD9TVB0_9ROSI|nr:hypothetical protein Ddye_024187 [Dipteronia dyeriana]
MTFRHNQTVEICKKEEGSHSPGTYYYYTATILAAIGRTRYLVRYENRYSEDKTRLLTESVDESDIRPSPPSVPYAGFQVPDRVDAFINEAWRLGSIARKVDPNYYVKLDSNGIEVHCPFYKVRLHLEFEDGRWIYYRPRNDAGEAITTGVTRNDDGKESSSEEPLRRDADQANTSEPRR